MSEAKSKKAAKKKVASKATPKTAPSASAKAGSSRKHSLESTAAVDGVELARLRRLARAGVEPPGRCALLGVDLDVGPRSCPWFRPVPTPDGVVSEIADCILMSGISPDELELAAARLRERGGQ